MKRSAQLVTAVALVLALVSLSASAFAASATTNALTGQVNINTATVQELILLPRIGDKIAGRIVAYRMHNGPFKAVTDLKNVKGVGDKVFSQLEKLVTISGATNLRFADK